MTPIEKARNYIQSKVHNPALAHPVLPEDIKRKVRNSNTWLNQFERVGDLITYLKRFQVSKSDPIYKALNSHGLLTFEDIAFDFENEFSLWANDYTHPRDFIVGEKYNGYQILIFAKSYDTRSGGMFVLESGKKPSTIIIKATLSGGRYANEWLDQPNCLKYYLKSINNEFGEHFKPNAAILNNPGIPIITFVRDIDNGPFTYQGIFKYSQFHHENDDSKWFELQRDADFATIENADFHKKVFTERVKAAGKDGKAQRQARLRTAQKKPDITLVLTTSYKRNPDVVAEVLDRAAGSCEICKQPAPFLRKSDGTPFLEVHHRITLADGGDDTVENAIALCPNCHRKSHFG